MQIQVGTISAMNLATGTVDVSFPDHVSPGLWLLDSVRTDTLAVDVSVLCAFPMGGGEGFCLGRHYNLGYAPGTSLSIKQDVEITGKLNVSGDVTAANFP